MTDYDGTLTAHVPDPAEAELEPAVRQRLTGLARAPHVRLAVISGRDPRDVGRRVAVPGAVYAGCHGLVIDGPGIAFDHPEALVQQGTVRAVGEALAARASGMEGIRIETKRLGMTIHYREMSEDGRRELEADLARAIDQCPGACLEVFHGTEAVEILPRVGWSKGHCALRIREWAARSLSQPMLSVYVGDDWTDELAFEALGGQAITVRVGPAGTASRATYRFDGVEDVHRLLERLAAAAGPRGAA